MIDPAVTSREYKLMLHTGKFENREYGSAKFQSLLEKILSKMECNYGIYTEERNRITWFLDTEENDLLNGNYILRIRDESDDKGRFKIMLKYRNADRYISASKDISSALEFEPKFEEDILPPFNSKYSNSSSVKLEELPELQRFSHLREIFPVLEELGISPNTPIKITNNFKAFEISRWVGAFDFGAGISVKACLNFWYKKNKCEGEPMISEFSFDYDMPEAELPGKNEIKKYPLSVVTNAEYFYNKLQAKEKWFARKNSGTKTMYAYELM